MHTVVPTQFICTTEILCTETDEVCQLNTTGIILAYFSSSVWLNQIPIPPSSMFVHDCHVQRSILKRRISGHGMTQVHSNNCMLPCVKSLESSPLVLVRFSAAASESFQLQCNHSPIREYCAPCSSPPSIAFSCGCNESCKDVENMESPLRVFKLAQANEEAQKRHHHNLRA